MLALDSTGTLLVSIPSQGRIVALPGGPAAGTASFALTVAASAASSRLAVRDGQPLGRETGRVLRFRYDVVLTARPNRS